MTIGVCDAVMAMTTQPLPFLPALRHVLAIRTRFVRCDSAAAGSSKPGGSGVTRQKSGSMTPVNVVPIRFFALLRRTV
jgi:hypothetical protein